MVDKLILKTNRAFTSFIQGLILFGAVVSFTSFLVDSVPVQAAETGGGVLSTTGDAVAKTPTTTPAAQTSDAGGLLALSSCTSDNPVTGGGGANLINCFKQVSTVAIIVGIILGGIMTAVDVLTSYVPGQSVNAGVNMQKRITSLITGIVLIAMPGAILNLFNPATTNINFLDRLKDLTRQKPPDPVVTTPTTPTNPANPKDPTNPGTPDPNKPDPKKPGTNTETVTITPKGMKAEPTAIDIDGCSLITVTDASSKATSFVACYDNGSQGIFKYKCLDLEIVNNNSQLGKPYAIIYKPNVPCVIPPGQVKEAK